MFVLSWLLTIAEVYAFTVVFYTVAWMGLFRIKLRDALYAAVRLYGFRSSKGQPFLHEHTREQRVAEFAEMDEHDLALIEAHKEVKQLLEGK